MDSRLFDRREAQQTPLEQFVSAMCREAGVKYRGIQKGFGKVADQVLVDNAHGSTLCVPLPGCTAEVLRDAVAQSNAAWANTPKVDVTTRRRTVVANKWIFTEAEAAD